MCYVNILWVFEYVIFKSFNGYIILVNNMYYLIVIIGYNNVFFGVKIDINWICQVYVFFKNFVFKLCELFILLRIDQKLMILGVCDYDFV